MSRRRRSPRSLRRTSGTRPERRIIWVFTEGKITEPAYIRALRSLPEVRERSAVRIELGSERDVPYPLVQLAAEKVDAENVDEVWCVFDVEHPDPHPRLREALDHAERTGVKTAISNPCFELWLVLHSRDQRGSMSTREAVKLAAQLAEVDGKHLDADSLLSRRAEASARAVKLAQMHESAGHSFPDTNPSSGMPALLAAIEGRGEPA